MRGTRSEGARSKQGRVRDEARRWETLWRRIRRLHLPGRQARDEQARLARCWTPRDLTNRRSRAPGSRGAR